MSALFDKKEPSFFSAPFCASLAVFFARYCVTSNITVLETLFNAIKNSSAPGGGSLIFVNKYISTAAFLNEIIIIFLASASSNSDVAGIIRLAASKPPEIILAITASCKRSSPKSISSLINCRSVLSSIIPNAPL